MVLYPLAEIRIGVLVAVRVGGRQLMMDILGDGKRSQRQKNDDESERKPARKKSERDPHGSEHSLSHKDIRVQSLAK